MHSDVEQVHLMRAHVALQASDSQEMTMCHRAVLMFNAAIGTLTCPIAIGAWDELGTLKLDDHVVKRFLQIHQWQLQPETTRHDIHASLQKYARLYSSSAC